MKMLEKAMRNEIKKKSVKPAKKSTLETILISEPEIVVEEHAKEVSSEDIPLLVFDASTGYMIPNPNHPEYTEHKAETSAKAILAKHSKGKKVKKTKGYISPFASPATPAKKEKVSSEAQIKELKAKILASLNDVTFELPFFSDGIFELLLTEDKIVNVPSETRQSNYHSLPPMFPYNASGKYEGQKGQSGTRGRCIFALSVNKSANDFIAFETFNRKAEGRNSTKDLSPNLFRRTLQAECKAYFPELHKVFNTLYPSSSFPDVMKVKKV